MTDGLVPQRMLRRRAALAIVLVAAAAGAAACGSQGGSGTTAPTASSATDSSTTTTAGTASSATAQPLDTSPGRHVVTFDVAGVQRRAVVVVPQQHDGPSPLVFGFHGHGGNGANFERRWQVERYWPEAIVVYPDGLVGHQGRTDPQGVKPGWQTRKGEAGDRDLAFFDTMLATLRAHLDVDRESIYVMGHSNGSAFASLVLNQRGDEIAATANMSAQPPPVMLASDPTRSMFMAMGRKDPIVPFANQQRSIAPAEQKLGVDPSRTTVSGNLRIEHGRDGLELDVYVYDGGHTPPAEVGRLVAEFFGRQSLPRR